MGEEDCSSPNPTPAGRKHRAIPARLQSPVSHNDDQLERAQARAARAASIRRKSVVPSPPSVRPDLLHADQIMDLFHNCIKLASENKINQKNTWELGLIDHLSEIIRAKPEDDDETNFQKASCTLEAGVKIYSMRVDSVHSEAYKVLGGINRAGREENQENLAMDADVDGEEVENLAKKELDKKMSPLSTLESSFEALNVKKFDAAFTVDPLYHQTSAQFDEGGAKGLLLNNLGVYGGCRVLFDSFEVPEKCILYETQEDKSELIDISFANAWIEEMMRDMPLKNDISPTLMDILSHFDEDNCRPSNAMNEEENHGSLDDVHDNNHAEFDGDAFGDSGPWNFDQDDLTRAVNDNFAKMHPDSVNHLEESGDYASHDAGLNDKLEKIADYLSLGMGLTSRSNTWAGPDHWKYRKCKGLEEVPVTASESELPTKKGKNRKVVSDIELSSHLDKEMVNIFAPPKNTKSLLLPVNKSSCNITLPEDCHYRPESLVKLFILPNIMCLGKIGRKLSDDSGQDKDTSTTPPSWEDDSGVNDDQFDDINVNSDTEDPGTLVCKPRQVSKIDIRYDKLSKQIDVHALKDMLWNQIRESVPKIELGQESSSISFKQVLSERAASSWNGGVSPHLYLICLLHLANEHCLRIHDCPSLDDLTIHVPESAALVN